MGFSMNVCDTEEIKKEVVEAVKPVQEEVKQLKSLTDNNVEAVMNLDMDSLEDRKSILKSIDEFGLDTIQRSSQKNALLEVSIKNLSKMGDEGGEVAVGLTELQRAMKDLDPSMIDFTKKGFFGRVSNPIRSYFDKYQKADNVINDIMESLERGKATLKNDNTTLEIEEISMRDLTKKLAKEIEMGIMMDEEISAALDKAKANNDDPDRISFVSEEILFPLRQRVMDMQQMIVVNQQGIIAIEVIRRNNKELIRGVDRAKNVTISALRTATIVASALYNQKIVLKKIDLLNKTTNDLISGTSKMLKEQGAEIQKQSIEANISIDTLKIAFSDTLEALNAISTYKQEALPKLKETIIQFKELADLGEKQISKLENREE
ncbi:toxic anion resistance protein [Clostridium sp. D43t1_170807_H7]|uniref:toxic anion resistance protein n=1 Tax=Clostridium sp. D43t1_170807_H7 TaxID=2787140 RepID=UPI00189904FB|nr:toxic anion resistance protein [Clostridium sp. D43t1_170807_H7]MEE0932688.1 toxic anion resistance protein [Clostridium sp.]